jgi:aminocarboxymuconate-semialdehyde decarboxylase
MKPSSRLKRIYIDSVVFTPQQLEALINVFGADHLLMGTDYPHDIAESDPNTHLASLGSVSSSAFAAIAGCDARQLFGL